MSNGIMTTFAVDIRYKDTNIEEVRESKCRDSTVTHHGNCDREVMLRIAYAGGAFSQLKNIWRCRNFSQKLKL